MDLNPEQIQQMIRLLQSMLPSEDIAQDNTVPTIKTKSRKQPPNTTGKNLFDTMTEARLHKDDCKIDKLLAVNEPTPRTRQFKPIQVKCRVCGKQESINPALLTETAERYKCNKCARSAG